MATDANAQLRVVLDDQISGPAESAAERLERMRETIERGRKELSQLQRAMRDMKKGGQESSEAYKNLEERVKSLQGNIAKTTGEYTNLGGTFAKVKPPLKQTSQFGSAMEQLDARTGGLVGRLKNMGGMLKTSSGRMMLLRGAMVAAALAAVALYAAIFKLAIAQSNLARSERLRLEAMAHLRGRSKHAIQDAENMQAAINRVADTTGGARDQIVGYAEAAYRAGLRGKALEHAVRGATIRGAALGEKYGKSFVFMATAAARAGQDVSKLADDAERRFGGLAQRRLNDLGNLGRRFKRNYSSLFDSVNIEPLLKSLSRFVNLFTKSNEVGAAVSRRANAQFGFLAKGLAKLVDLASWWVETFTLLTTKVEVHFKRVGLVVLDVIIFIKERFEGLFETISNFKLPAWVETAKNIGFGIVEGLDSARGMVGKAGGKLAAAAAAGFRKVAQIKSPSKLFEGYGDDISVGFALGVEGGAPRAHEAIGDLVDVPSFPALPVPDLSGISAGRSSTITITIGDIVTQASDGAEVLETLRLRVGDVLRDLVIQEGLA